MSVSDESREPLFPTLREAADAADDEQPTATQIESLCMNCHQNGETRLLLTRIPHYKQVVLMSFSCPHCGFSNNELQSGAPVADKGIRYTLEAGEPRDLNRQIVKSDYASIAIPQADLEIPAGSQKGEITTVEGVVMRAVEGLSRNQEERRRDSPEQARLIQQVIDKLNELLNKDNFTRFTLKLEDISGNSWIENPQAPAPDPRCRVAHFLRSPQQDHELGVYTQSELHDQPESGVLTRAGGAAGEGGEEGGYERLAREEVLTFPTNCPECGALADTHMKLTKIPHFKEVVIMATSCEACGHRTNEVKSGGGIEERGVRIELRIAGKDDFSRDVLKSETCSMSISELDLEVGGAALGGRFTTAEGLIRATLEQLSDAPELVGDSVAPDRSSNMHKFLQQLEEVLAGERAVTLVLDDPAGNSYVQSLSDEGLDDNLTITRYERTFEQNEELGLNDMKTEDYHQP